MYTYSTSDDVSVSNSLKASGWFHVIIGDASEGVVSSSAAIIVNGAVLDGTVPGQRDKQFRMTLWMPRPDHKDQGKFCRIVHTRLFISAGIMSEGDKGKEVQVEFAKFKGRQMVVKFEVNNKGYAELDGAHIYHVDDPEVASYPKCPMGLAVIPPSLRRVSGKPVPQSAHSAPVQEKRLSADDLLKSLNG